jgi:hypothetical protein
MSSSAERSAGSPLHECARFAEARDPLIPDDGLAAEGNR